MVDHVRKRAASPFVMRQARGRAGAARRDDGDVGALVGRGADPARADPEFGACPAAQGGQPRHRAAAPGRRRPARPDQDRKAQGGLRRVAAQVGQGPGPGPRDPHRQDVDAGRARSHQDRARGGPHGDRRLPRLEGWKREVGGERHRPRGRGQGEGVRGRQADCGKGREEAGRPGPVRGVHDPGAGAREVRETRDVRRDHVRGGRRPGRPSSRRSPGHAKPAAGSPRAPSRR